MAALYAAASEGSHCESSEQLDVPFWGIEVQSHRRLEHNTNNTTSPLGARGRLGSELPGAAGSGSTRDGAVPLLVPRGGAAHELPNWSSRIRGRSRSQQQPSAAAAAPSRHESTLLKQVLTAAARDAQLEQQRHSSPPPWGAPDRAAQPPVRRKLQLQPGPELTSVQAAGPAWGIGY